MSKIRIVDADFYFASPINGLDALTSEFRSTQISKVPLIRIFGATDDGNKTCLHVHGVFPYIYIPHDGKEHHEALRYKLANSIDKTLNVALGQAASKVQHVYKISLISGIPYYGYHSREHQFFQIFFYNPHLMKKVCTFFENGTILGRVYQPHEAHIPYIQQFMIDYNLHGMSFIQLSEVHHRYLNGRAPVVTSPGNYVLPANIARISRCVWECDVRAECILNIQDVVPNAMTNPGIAAIWADERQRRINLSQSSQVSHILTQNRKDLEPTQSHIVYQQKLHEQLLSSESSRVEKQQDDANVSVYPAETPESGDLLSGGSESFDISYIEDTDASQAVDDVDCQRLYTVLRDLAEANDIAHKTTVPEDSILSQLSSANVSANEEIGLDEDEEHELDLSMPLENTPVKQQTVMNSDSGDEFDNISDSYFINIPQLDGSYDLRSRSVKNTSNIKCTEQSIMKKDDVKGSCKKVIKNIKKDIVKKETDRTVCNSLQKNKSIQSIVTTSNQSKEPKSTEELTLKRTTTHCSKPCGKPMDGNNTSKTSPRQIIPAPRQSTVRKSRNQRSKHLDDKFACNSEESNKNNRLARNKVLAVDVTVKNVHSTYALPQTKSNNDKIIALNSQQSNEPSEHSIEISNKRSKSQKPRTLHNSIKSSLNQSSKCKLNDLDERRSCRSMKAASVANVTFENIQNTLKSLSNQQELCKEGCRSPNPPYQGSEDSTGTTEKDDFKAQQTPLTNYINEKNGNTVEKLKWLPSKTPDENKSCQIIPPISANTRRHCARKVITSDFANSIHFQIRRSERLKNKIGLKKIETLSHSANSSRILADFVTLQLSEIEICEAITEDKSSGSKATREPFLYLSKNYKASVNVSNNLPAVNITGIEINCDASNKVKIFQPIFGNKSTHWKPPESFLYQPNDYTCKISLASIKAIVKTPTVSKSLIKMYDSSHKLEITAKRVESDTIFVDPVRGLSDSLPQHSINKDNEPIIKTCTKSQYNVRKRNLNDNKGVRIFSESNPSMKGDDNNIYSDEFLELFYNYLCKENNTEDDGCTKARNRKMKGRTCNNLCIEQGLDKGKINIFLKQFLRNNELPKKGCTKAYTRKMRTTTKCYKEVSIKQCLNGRSPCNHYKRQCHKNRDDIGSGCTNNNVGTEWNNMPILNCSSSFYLPPINNNYLKHASCTSALKENVLGLNIDQKVQKPKRKSNKQTKLSVVKAFPKKTRNKILSSKTLRCRKKLRSKRLEQEVQKDLVKYIALQTGKKPKFNLVYGRTHPVVALNISKVNSNQFPNTEWSSELVDGCHTLKQQCKNNLVVLEDKTLEDHEKFDLSSLFCNMEVPLPNETYDDSMNTINNNYVSTNFNTTYFDSTLFPLDVLDYNETLPDIDNYINNSNDSDNFIDVDQLLQDIYKVHSISSCINEVENAEDINNTSEENNENVHGCQSETNNAVDEEYEKEVKAAEIQFLFDKNNYRSQLTMEKFRYVKRNQDRAFVNLKKYFSRYVENFNMNGRLVMQEVEREAREATNQLSDDDDDAKSGHFFLHKTVRFKKRMIVREYLPTAPISERMYNDTICTLYSEDQVPWTNLNKPLTYDHLLNVDGPNDSTDDEDGSKIPKKRARVVRKKPSYKSLPLVCGKLSQVTHTGAREIPFPPETTKSGNQVLKTENSVGSTPAIYSPQLTCSNNANISTLCDNTVFSAAKRKLSFQEIDSCALDKTIIEESISCRFRSKISSPSVNLISIDNRCDKPVLRGITKEEGNSSEDLFSDEEVDVPNCYLTKSERYDLEANYVPKAGTSAMKSSGEVSQVIPGASTDLDTVTSASPKKDNGAHIEIKTSESKYFGLPTIDAIFLQNKSQELELDRTITQTSFTNEDCSDLSLGDTTTFKKQYLDNTLTEPQSLTQNLTLYESSPKVNYKETVDGFCELVPKYKPPNKEFIQSTMIAFNIPFVRTQMPFYGNSADVTGPVEVGMQSLYIRGKSAEYLPDFHDDNDALAKAATNFSKRLNPDRKFTSREVTNVKMSFFGDETRVVETVCKPPSKADVKLWLKEKLKNIIGSNQIFSETKLNEATTSTSQTSLESNGDIIKNSNSTNNSLSAGINNGESSIDAPIEKKRTLKHYSDSRKNINMLHLNLPCPIPAIHHRSLDNSCQITGATLNNTHGFAMSLENLQDARAVTEHQHLTAIVMELHMQTRGDFKPNPELDPLCAIFFAIFNDVPDDGATPRQLNGLFAVNTPPISKSQSSGLHLNGAGVSSCSVKYFDDEVSLINGFIAFLHECDPDILAGYEIQMLSWGYLIERSASLGINLYPLLSRIEDPTPASREKHEDAFGDLYITGRVVLDLWRILKHEIALQSYTFENIVFHILHQRVPLHSFRDLTSWWSHRFPSYRHKTVEYYIYRVNTTLQLVDQLDLIGRTSEMARLFGILFYEVLSRGSQFRVESMMLRLAKPLKYIPVSPSVQQRAKMRAPEFVPLILEPDSKLYTDPVIVLDFQSLYPSIIIAYNYCFSTCIGRIEHLGSNSAFEFGATQLKISRRKVGKLLRTDQLNFSPCGVAFVKGEVRQGILPRMLQEILDTRLMVKKSMKRHKSNKTLQRVLHSRQLGLKLIANVTYGYTAANFSGRMPSVEVGDSVVAKGRETLRRAIKLVESHPTWNCRVVYGDTDSLFVLVHGRDRAEAFRIGAEIAEAVTAANPSPVRLKLEKVYQPCILQTKKRYVGYMYETPDQIAPVYEAKGIETVRRDGCPAVAKMLEKCIRILFESRDVSQIKQYVLRQFSKIFSSRASIQDLTFAKEYRGASGYRPTACVPALELTRKWIAIDKRNEPRSGERVPYVIVNGPPGIPLIRMVRSPRELLLDDSLKPNALYYITRVIIPPINRCFKLIGADLHQWFNEMPRKQYKYLPTSSPNKGKKSTISQYFTTINCATCDQQTKDGVCPLCYMQPQRTSFILHEKIRTLERSYQNTLKICESCTGRKTDIQCISLDCPVLYRHIRNERDLQQSNFIRELINNLPRLDEF